MRSNLDRMDEEVKKVRKSQKLEIALRCEIKRVFGSLIDSDTSLSELIETVNNLLDGPRFKKSSVDVKPSVSLRLMEHSDARVRLFAVRTVPQNYVERFIHDRDRSVRLAAAERALPRQLDEMLRRHPDDDQLRVIAEEREILDPKKFSLASKQRIDPKSLTDQWYETQASGLIKRYHNNLEGRWEEIAVRQFVNAMRSTNGVVIDEEKLYKTLKKRMDEREQDRLKALDDDPLAEQPLKESIEWLRLGGHRINMQAPAFPIIEERVDKVRDLLESNSGSIEYVRTFNELFCVLESRIPAAVRKFRIGESKEEFKIPVKCKCPTVIGQIEEQALDRYVRSWNEIQYRRGTEGEPLRISWNHVDDQNVSFETILR